VANTPGQEGMCRLKRVTIASVGFLAALCSDCSGARDSRDGESSALYGGGMLPRVALVEFPADDADRALRFWSERNRFVPAKAG
jgi:hypothetical protein